MGWLLLYSGISKVMNASWSSKGYLESATSFTGFYQWLANPVNVTWVDFINQWGQVALGLALIFGVFVNFAATAGILMMALYYLPTLHFPFAGRNSFIIDEHIIYILVFLLLIRERAGRHYGIGSLFGRTPY